MISVPAKPFVITWLPTRRCNLKCEYCRIRDNQFPELMESDIHRVISVFKKHFSDAFLVVLGGDVTVWGKQRMIRFVNALSSLNYAIVTNGVLIDESYLEELMIAGLKNLSLSVDPQGCMDRSKKSVKALELISLARRLGLKDRHATLTLDRKNFKDAPKLVKTLTKEGCWAEITPYIAHPSPDYDFGFYSESLTFKKSDYFALRSVMKELVEMKKAGYLIHNTSDYLLEFASNVCGEKYPWRCKGMVNLVVDADGTLRPCLHLRGREIKQFNVLKWLQQGNVPYGDIHLAWRKDVEQQCEGCYWNCQWEAERVYDKHKHLGVEKAWGKVQDYFSHKSD